MTRRAATARLSLLTLGVVAVANCAESPTAPSGDRGTKPRLDLVCVDSAGDTTGMMPAPGSGGVGGSGSTTGGGGGISCPTGGWTLPW